MLFFCACLLMFSLSSEVMFPEIKHFFFVVSCLDFFNLQDWLDIDFGITEGVDFIAISFVKSAEVINHLKSYIAARSRDR